MHLRIPCNFIYLWRNYESRSPFYECLRLYMGGLAGHIYFWYSGRSCTCQLHIYFFVDWGKATIGKTSEDKGEIRFNAIGIKG